MDNKKFEQLIDLIINEDEDKARALFHDIVVEKSREIYENMMEAEESGDEEEETVEEGFEMEEGHDEVGGLLDEISAEEDGVAEDDDEFADIEVDDDDGLGDEEDMGDMEGEENLENRVVDLEDKLDELMAEFEEMMGHEEGEEDFGGEEEGEEGEEDFGGEEEMGDEEMMEAVQLQKVSVTHGDNGQNTKSVVSNGPKVPGNGAKAIHPNDGNTSGGTVKAPATIPGNYKNAPGSKFSEKGEAAPKPKHGDNGQNTKSVLESKKTAKKIIKK